MPTHRHPQALVSSVKPQLVSLPPPTLSLSLGISPSLSFATDRLTERRLAYSATSQPDRPTRGGSSMQRHDAAHSTTRHHDAASAQPPWERRPADRPVDWPVRLTAASPPSPCWNSCDVTSDVIAPPRRAHRDATAVASRHERRWRWSGRARRHQRR